MIGRNEVRFEPHHAELDARLRVFAHERIEPLEAEGGEEDAQARRFIGVLADGGLLDYVLPKTKPSGRRGIDARSLCLVRENLARASGFADCMFVMQGLGSAPVWIAGTKDQQAAVLPRVASGLAIAAFALTEPEAGSDVASMRTTATKVDGGYAIDGIKTFISNAGVADVYSVFAKTDVNAGAKGISAFVVEKSNPGLHVVERQRVIAPHPIGTLRFERCFVPDSALLGDVNEGFSIAMKTLDVFRPTVGAAACGLARRALAEALARASTRVQFGKPIAAFQGIQFHLAQMAADVEASRLLVYRAATLQDTTDAPTTRESSLAKWQATEAAQRVIDKAVQIFGGAGVLVGSIVERLYREIRALRIYEGTSEIQQVVIATRLLKDGNPGY